MNKREKEMFGKYNKSMFEKYSKSGYGYNTYRCPRCGNKLKTVKATKYDYGYIICKKCGYGYNTYK